MNLEKDISLSTLTSFHSGGVASFVVHCTSVAEVQEAVAFATEQKLPWYVLGEGTNVLADDEGFAGMILRMELEGITYNEQEAKTLVRAGAGVSWDTLVEEVTARGLWGIENLAGIPGTVGAGPVQNIGAYGMELKDTFVSCEVFDTTKGTVTAMQGDECQFGYRDSIFKQNKHLIILSVTLSVSAKGAPKISYGDLQKALQQGIDLTSPSTIARAVREIRSQKFPDLQIYGTAGSFFKNPILSTAEYAALVAQYGEIPQYPHAKGIKIPLAYVLDKLLQLRGHKEGNAWLFEAQPLVLVLTRGGMSRDVERLAQYVAQNVFEKTNIHIEREVQTLRTT